MKKLTLREMHRLYLLLRDCLPEKEERYLVDEIEAMVGRMKRDRTLILAVEIMFPESKIDRNNPLELLILLIRGLKHNDFFEYVSFVNKLKDGRRNS